MTSYKKKSQKTYDLRGKIKVKDRFPRWGRRIARDASFSRKDVRGDRYHRRGELIPPSTRKTAVDLAREFKKYGIIYVMAGAIPVQYYGRERMSRDVDFVVSLDERRAEGLLRILKKSRYNIIYPGSDKVKSPSDLLNLSMVKIRDLETGSLADIILRPSDVGFKFDEESLRRVREVTFNGENIPLPSPEDYIIMKLKARRPGTHDFEDIISTISAQFNSLDWQYLNRRAEEENLTSLLNYYRDAVKRKLERTEGLEEA